ncbi:T9SS type A sorting domain-containing protein, partial [bacterium]|nr:T9SS type A sorting domain-containing protein [bacterium]
AMLAGAAVAQDFTLTIFHNNDGESDVLPDGDGFGGAANFITKLDELRSATTTDGHIMLSSGDNFLAGPEFSASLENGVPFYDTIVMDLIGYDAVCIGNHDFDFNPDVLADFMAGYTTLPPYLSSNLDFSAEPNLQAYVDSGDLTGSVILDVAGEQVGVIGATTENLPFISSPRNVVVDAVAPAVLAEVAALESAGVDKIILISHLQSVLEDQMLAAELSGIDVMIAGGGDELLANEDDLLIPGDVPSGAYPLYATDADGFEIPVVTTSGQYRYIGRLEVTFDMDGDVTTVDGGPVRVADETYADGAVADATAQTQAIDPILAYIEDLDETIIAQSEVDLDGIRANVRTEETNQGNLNADAMLWQARQLADEFDVPMADVAIQNGGGIRNDSIIPAGPLTLLDTFDMLPFPNLVVVFDDISRENLKEILENCVSRVEFVDGRFGQVAGMRFLYDPLGTPQELDEDGNVVVPGMRVQEIVLMDEPQTVICEDGMVVPGEGVSLAIVDFLARGGDQYPFRGQPFTALGVSYQQALANYITEGLGGQITAVDYPEGGEGRIVTEGTVAIENPGQSDETPVASIALGQNFPNPFNPATSIAFSLPRNQRVTLTIYDLQGRLVRTLVDDVRAAGEHTVAWTGTTDAGQRAASGTYMYRLVTGDRVLNRTMTLVK